VDFKNKKILVAYFSHKGQNYVSGSSVELKKGNTAVVADMIAGLTNAVMFEIRSLKEYPFAYNECTAEAQAELRANSRPKLAEDIDVTDYDVIFLGYPNWWSTMPMLVWSFLERHDFTGKIIYPFCTHEGSGMGSSESDLRKLTMGADIKNGLAIYGSSVSQAKSSIENWIMKG
jgi:Flavodoxins